MTGLPLNLRHECPTCGAPPWCPCLTRSGGRSQVHILRRNLDITTGDGGKSTPEPKCASDETQREHDRHDPSVSGGLL